MFITKILCRGGHSRLEAIAGFRLAFGRGVESIRDQIEQNARDFLRIDIRSADRRIKTALHRNIEVWLFSSCAMISQIQALIDDRVDVGETVLAGTLARMQQHVLDDGVGALAMLHDLFEIVLQHAGQFVDFFADLAVHARPA